jgi:hypothetical protein
VDVECIIGLSSLRQQDDFLGATQESGQDPMVFDSSHTENRWLVGVWRREGVFQAEKLSHGIGPERRGESGSFGVGR